MSESHVSINGMPLNVALTIEQNTEISQHFRSEVNALGKQCAVRHFSSKPKLHLGHLGRPKKGVSISFVTELEPFLKDESYSLAGIADLFNLSVGELQFYARRVGIHRKRGRKPRVEQRRAA